MIANALTCTDVTLDLLMAAADGAWHCVLLLHRASKAWCEEVPLEMGNTIAWTSGHECTYPPFFGS